MKRWLITLVAMVVLVLSVNVVKAGTLERGVQLSPFFVVGAYGNAMVTSLKYQMAVDSRIGLENRYRTITYNTGTFNTFESTISGGTTPTITITNTTTNSTYYQYY